MHQAEVIDQIKGDKGRLTSLSTPPGTSSNAAKGHRQQLLLVHIGDITRKLAQVSPALCAA
jgi:ribosomal protein L21